MYRDPQFTSSLHSHLPTNQGNQRSLGIRRIPSSRLWAAHPLAWFCIKTLKFLFHDFSLSQCGHTHPRGGHQQRNNVKSLVRLYSLKQLSIPLYQPTNEFAAQAPQGTIQTQIRWQGFTCMSPLEVVNNGNGFSFHKTEIWADQMQNSMISIKPLEKLTEVSPCLRKFKSIVIDFF